MQRWNTKQVAEFMGIHVGTLYVGLETGDPQFSELPYWRTSSGPRAHYRFDADQVQEWWKKKTQRPVVRLRKAAS